MTPAIDNLLLAAGRSPAASILLKATAAAVLGLAAAAIARRGRASVRHAILAGTFAVLLLLPLVALFAPPLSIAVPVAAQGSAIPVDAPVASAAVTNSTPRESRTTTTATQPAGVSPIGLALWAWLLGVTLFLTPAVIGLWQVFSLRRSARPWPEGRPALDALLRESTLRRHVHLLLQDSVLSPMTTGILRPAILLPAAATRWDTDDLNRALLHELEHIRRVDFLSHAVARTLCAVYWFHPLVWIAWRMLALEAERACDDAVLRHSEPTAYADQLFALARQLSAAAKSPMLAMASRADLTSRVRSMLDVRRPRGRAGKLAVGIACIAVSAFVLAVAPLAVTAQPIPAPAPLPAIVASETPAPAAVDTGPARPLPAPQAAPQPAPQQNARPTPQYSANTFLVVVNAKVTTSGGEPVEGLEAANFQLLEDGQPQHISFCDFQSGYYTIGYYTAKDHLDGNYRQIKLTVPSRSGILIDRRIGYYAGPPGVVDGIAGADGSDLPPGYTQPIPIYKPDAEYSPEARKAKYQGIVGLFVQLDETGKATRIQVLRAIGLGLDEAAVRAVGTWRFKPAMLNGVAVPAAIRVNVRFALF